MERLADGNKIEGLPVVVLGLSGQNFHGVPLDQIPLSVG